MISLREAAKDIIDLHRLAASRKRGQARIKIELQPPDLIGPSGPFFLAFPVETTRDLPASSGASL